MEGGDQLFRDITNGHSLRPRTPEGKAALLKRKSKEDLELVPEGGMVTGRVTGKRGKFLAANMDAFLPGVERKQKKKNERRQRNNRQQVVGGGRPLDALQNFLPGVPTQVGQLIICPPKEMQEEGDGALHQQVKVETPGEEVAFVRMVPEEANELELASRKLRILKKKKEIAEGRVQFYTEKIAQLTLIVKDLAGQL